MLLFGERAPEVGRDVARDKRRSSRPASDYGSIKIPPRHPSTLRLRPKKTGLRAIRFVYRYPSIRQWWTQGKL